MIERANASPPLIIVGLAQLGLLSAAGSILGGIVGKIRMFPKIGNFVQVRTKKAIPNARYRKK